MKCESGNNRVGVTVRAIERCALQAAIAIAGCVPVGAGLAGIIDGAAMLGLAGPPAADSHVRYLSGLLLATGLGFRSAIPDIEMHGRRIWLLAAIVVAGGLARLGGTVQTGWPDSATAFALAMELVVTPLLVLWQRRVSRLAPPTA